MTVTNSRLPAKAILEEWPFGQLEHVCAAAQRQAQEMDLLAQWRHSLLAGGRLSVYGGEVTAALARGRGFSLVALYLVGKDKLVLLAQAGAAEAPATLPLEYGLPGAVVAGDQTLLYDEQPAGNLKTALLGEATAAAGAPIRGHGRVVGMLYVESAGRPPVGAADLALLEAAADHVGLAWRQAKLWRQVRRSEANLSRLDQSDRRSGRIQAALHQIASVAASDVSLDELYASLHRIVGELMYAHNFFIALYDPQADLVRLPYFVDEFDPDDRPYRPGKGLTEYVLRTGEPLLINDAEHDELIGRGELELVGPQSPIWLGVPLKWKGSTFGAVVVQHYSDPSAYTEREKDVLAFVSGQVATAIERKQAAERLRESRQMLQLVMNNIPQQIFWKDTSLVFLGCNENFARAAGVASPDEIGGKTDYDLGWPREQAEVFRQQDRQAMEGNDPLPRVIEWQRQATGKRALMETARIPLFDADGQVVGILGASEDITEKAQAEGALRQAQKLESLGILAGGVAHDFNNLLVAILGHSSMAMNQLPPGSPARVSVEKSVTAAKRAADLTRQLLAYSGRGQFEAALLHLNALIEDNLHLFELALPRQIRLAPLLASPLPLIEADPGQMQQVVMNLILNAGDAIGERPGVIGIATAVETVEDGEDGPLSYTGDRLVAGRYVSLEVSDNGHGMDTGTLGKIFDPFFSTKFTGRGLGLAAVLGIVRGHKGALQVSSRPGEGTSFRLFFPASDRLLLPEAPVLGREPQPEVDRGMVLVIDDEALVREAATDILAMEEIPVLVAPDGESGLRLYKERRQEISLVILDLSMPGLDGAATLQRLLEIDPAARVLLSSGYSQIELGRRFAGSGLAGFLQKPYTMEHFLAEVCRHLRPAGQS